MTPYDAFESVWRRCDELRGLYQYLAGHLTGALKPDELLRAEWVSRVSALDLYVHELVAQNMLGIFEDARPRVAAFRKFQVSSDTLIRIRSASNSREASAAFDLEVRSRLGYMSFQDPEKIADGIRLISDKELWNEVATINGASRNNRKDMARNLKRKLSLIVERRNKIAHEGDLQPSVPREPWEISLSDVEDVEKFIKKVVDAIERIV